MKGKEFGGTDPGDNCAALLDRARKPLNHFVHDGVVREFDFRQYLFSRQAQVLSTQTTASCLLYLLPLFFSFLDESGYVVRSLNTTSLMITAPFQCESSSRIGCKRSRIHHDIFKNSYSTRGTIILVHRSFSCNSSICCAFLLEGILTHETCVCEILNLVVTITALLLIHLSFEYTL